MQTEQTWDPVKEGYGQLTYKIDASGIDIDLFAVHSTE